MAPNRAVEFVRSFDLPEEEAQSIILCDVRQKSYVQASDILHLSQESIKRKRRKALDKIIDALTHLFDKDAEGPGEKLAAYYHSVVKG